MRRRADWAVALVVTVMLIDPWDPVWSELAFAQQPATSGSSENLNSTTTSKDISGGTERTTTVTTPDGTVVKQTTTTDTTTKDANGNETHTHESTTTENRLNGSKQTTETTVKETTKDGTKETKTETTTEYDKPMEKDPASGKLKPGGKPTGGVKERSDIDPKQKTKRRRTYKLNPKSNTWEQQQSETVPLKTATSPTVYLPDTASAGTVVTGTIETQVNEVAGGVVIAKAPDGQERSVVVGADGRFLLPAASVRVGTVLTVRDLGGDVIATRPLKVSPGGSGGIEAAPSVSQVPGILPQGGVARITGSNLCSLKTLTEPSVLLNTPRTADVVSALASSGQELLFRVPKTVQPGPGSLMVDNGVGELSAPRVVNPVKIAITTPPRVSVGQPFAANINVEGLTPANRQKSLMATVVVSGNATFAGGQREMRVSVEQGAAKVPVIAQGAGAYEVRVTGITGEAP